MKTESEYRREFLKYKFDKKLYCETISIKYPDIVLITLNVKLHYPNALTLAKKEFQLRFYPADKAYFGIECLNPQCCDSDLDLADIIGNMINKNSEFAIGYKVCKGYDTYPNYKQKRGHCLTELEYAIIIQYHVMPVKQATT